MCEALSNKIYFFGKKYKVVKHILYRKEKAMWSLGKSYKSECWTASGKEI